MVVKESLSRFFVALLSVVLAISLIPLTPALAEPEQQEPSAQEQGEAQDEQLDVSREDGQQARSSENQLTTEDEQEIVYSAESPKEQVSEEESQPVSTQASSLREQAAAILKDCAVTIDHEGSFTAEDARTHVSVCLSDQVSRCNLTLFAYAANTSFDPDSSQNIRLWSGSVSDGWEDDVEFAALALPLKPGYKVIACLNVPITEDYYRACNSAAIPVLDEQGEGFVDYDYPDAFITEDELEAGATSLHVSMTGDERLFQAAREGKISLTLSVAQYPDDAEFDFENADQIPLCSLVNVTDAITDQEIQLSEPLRAGYRVRAVVYWSQNPDIFLVKGNDYESVFHRVDDSIVVNEDQSPRVNITEQLTTNSTTVPIELGGQIPGGSLILVKKFAADETIAVDKGTPVGMSFDMTSTTAEVKLNDGVVLEEGDRVVAFVLSAGNPIAQSEAFTVAKHVPVNVEYRSNLTTESSAFAVSVRLNDPALASEQLNVVQLKKLNANGTTDTDFGSVVAGKYMQDQGEITFDLSNVSLEAGQKLYVRVMNYAHDIDFFSDPITVADASKNEVVLEGTSVAVDAEALSVNVSGCAAFEGGRLIATIGSASESDPDSRTQLTQTVFTGAGTYTLSVPSGRLRTGQSVMIHLYKYDSEADTTQYLVGNQLPIVESGASVIEPTVNIVTSGITADRSDVWVQANYDPEKVGRLTLYSYEGDTWTADDQIFSEIITPQENSQRITFGADKLVAGGKLVAVLTLYGGGQAQEYVSDAVSVAAPPEKQKPAAQITSKKVTAGMTTITAALTFDPADEGAYTLYRFTGDSLDAALEEGSATALSSATLYRSDPSRSIYLGTNKISAGDKLQLVLRAGGVEARSNVMSVEESPDWGTPYVVFDTAAAQVGAASIPVKVDYAYEYDEMEDFFCDVSIYQVSAAYSDEEIEEKELWENSYLTQRVGQLNSTLGQVTRGELEVKLYDWIDLDPGNRLFIKLRLPHVEWEGEEVDYVSASIPVLAEGEQLAPVKVLLYNLGEDTARGSHVRSILAKLGVEVETVTGESLDQSIGYLAGLSGFEKNEDAFWDGNAPSTEFMLMCGFGEALLDKFLDAMQAQGLRIDHKAIVTDYNRYYTLSELIGDIEEEHEVFQELLAIDKVIKAAEALDESTYGQVEGWDAFQVALARAQEILASEEPAAEDLAAARKALIAAGNAITEGQFWVETETPVDPDPIEPDPIEPDPADPVDPIVPGNPDIPSQDDQEGSTEPSAGEDNANKGNSTNTTGNTTNVAQSSGAAASAAIASKQATVARSSAEQDDGTAASDADAQSVTDDESGDLEAEEPSAFQVEDDETPLAEHAGQDNLMWLWAGIAAIAAAGLIFVIVRRRRNEEK